jgi:hypothetical protein
MTTRPDAEKTLARLKDFQRRSVDYVFRRLYTDEDQVDRFLLADEVGLGKTMVARGVTARAVNHLWDRIDRIDVVYICSNGDIARQNINRLKLADQEDFAFASRLTLLPLHTRDLAARKLNFVSFTPGTSFELGTRSGIVQERALLYYLLKEPWDLHGAGPKNVLQCGAATDGWREYLRWFRDEQRASMDPKLTSSFVAELEADPTLKERFAELCERFQRDRQRIPHDDRRLRNELIGALRRLLARCCVRELQPDLVILDEFQRFRHLLHGEDEVATLARELFTYRSHQGNRARVLLLSATPYKMYTLSQEAEDDHYRDFLHTTRFLFASDADAGEFERELRDYRAALCLGGDGSELSISREAIEKRLRKVMCRTERLAVSTDRNGMLGEVSTPTATLSAMDAAAYAWIDRTASMVGAADCVELWKSGSYLLNFMDDYELKRKVRQALARSDDGLLAALREPAASLFQSESVRRYAPVDVGNARLRALLSESIDCGGWQLLWMPPSLPYYTPRGVFADPNLADFTKALVFSSWQLVPKVIAILGSYEAERRMVRSGEAEIPYAELRERQRPLLRFAQVEDRLTGMSLLPLLYPCTTLCREVDPLAIGRELAATGVMASPEAVLAVVGSRIRELLQPSLAAARPDGQADERWYWAALLLLDRDRYPGVLDWLCERGDEAWRNMGGEDDSNFSLHVDLARGFFDDPERLGPPPPDLIAVLAKVAVASPAVVALRSLERRWPDETNAPPPRLEPFADEPLGSDVGLGISSPLLSAAARIGMGFRALFNRPETILYLRGMNSAEPYWERVLDYGIDGNLQAVIDEYTHVLVESLGLESAGSGAAIEVARRFNDAVSLRTIALGFDEIVPDADGGVVQRQQRMRCRYALRFGEGEGEDSGEVTREDQVRSAFNSPFRPFILASTSVGQEGLDFHLYCRAVYHWNLPTNPVDLEQREGRIHRYKGYVIRKNLAAKYGIAATAGALEPWDAVFAAAVSGRAGDQSDLVPYWVFEGPWKIERRVPMFGLSREVSRLEDLKRSLALYRLVFGQPRQEELLRLLRSRLDGVTAPAALLSCRIDLTPADSVDAQPIPSTSAHP